MKTPSTYCNPISLPDYPRGTCSKNKNHADPFHFLQDPPADFRELADPSVIFFGNKWYLYPSCGMAYVTEDFVTWEHIPLSTPDIGYAPTVVEHRGRFLMTACSAPVFESASPLGPFKEIGYMHNIDGTPVKDFLDPMLFADDDGRLYAVWGLGRDGIRVAEVDGEHPDRLITKPEIMIKYNPDHEWEHFGPCNEDPSKSFCEGPWMVKIGKKYYLTYAAPGTEWRTYGMGAYVADSPLGPFKYQTRNPILRKTAGFVQGPGHGSIVKGPNNTLWAFYTCTCCYEHVFERRLGMDPAGVDENGELFVLPASEFPQFTPGKNAHPELGNGAGLLPFTLARPAVATSSAPGRNPIYACDGSMLTWWQPADGDTKKTITMSCRARFTAESVRIAWKDVGLDYDNGVTPGPFKYRVYTSLDCEKWTLVLDASENTTDLLIDYRVFDKPVEAEFVRLEITGAPKGITPGVIDFSIFGRGIPKLSRS